MLPFREREFGNAPAPRSPKGGSAGKAGRSHARRRLLFSWLPVFPLSKDFPGQAMYVLGNGIHVSREEEKKPTPTREEPQHSLSFPKRVYFSNPPED